ncbi:MAG: Ger(x)C family spore germination C-terminal domain-containing protein [Candidatus Metalachnospira sp.]|nr:Ger(x)C family spore germination C-terminal domain-containing protein [Candidatus Metalachnospira sp.]
MNGIKLKCKKILTLIVSAVIPLIILTGCWGKTETEDRKYVVTMGIDSDDEYTNLSDKYDIIGTKGDFIVSMGAARIKSDIGKESEQANMSVFRGENTAEIRETANNYSNNDIYFGQLKTVVIGKDIIKDNETFKNMISDIERTEKINKKVIAVVAENDAAQIIQKIMEDGEGNGMYIWNYYKNKDVKFDLGEYMDFEHLVKSMRNKEAIIVPQVSIKNQNIVLEGGSVINKDGYCGDVTKEVLDGLKWIEGDAKGEIVSADGISIRVLSQNVKSKMNDGIFTVKTSVDCVVENGQITDKSLNELKSVINDKIENTINKAIELNADIFKISDDGNITGLNYDISVDIKITSTGVIK